MKYLEKKLYVFAKMLILISVFNTALGVMGNEYNLLLRLVQEPKWLRAFYIIIGVIAVWVAIKRETYLPFLGECALPGTVFKSGSNVPSTADKLVTLKVSAPNASKVVWWAAKPEADGQKGTADVYAAYDNYMNSGVVEVVNGEATIAFMCPQPYYIDHKIHKKTIKRHIHYREIDNSGLLGKVETLYVDC